MDHAIKTAAEQNVNPFASSSLSLTSPLLWVAVAATVAIHFISENYSAEKVKEDKESARIESVKNNLERYRAERRERDT